MKDEHISITGNAPHSPFLKKGTLDNTGNSIKYKVGERFPHSQYLNYGEITVSVFNDTFFDILSCLYDLSGKEIKIFQNGDFQFSLFTFEGVPFICINFIGADLSFDLSLDITKLSAVQQENWLNSDSNVINMFLVDAESGILKAMRTFTIKFSEDIRDILEEQSAFESGKVGEIIRRVNTQFTTDYMIKNATKKLLFKRR